MYAKPPNPDTATPPEGLGSVDEAAVAVGGFSSEVTVAEVVASSGLVEAAEMVEPVVIEVVVAVFAVVLAAVLISSTVGEVVTVTFGQHPTL